MWWSKFGYGVNWEEMGWGWNPEVLDQVSLLDGWTWMGGSISKGLSFPFVNCGVWERWLGSFQLKNPVITVIDCLALFKKLWPHIHSFCCPVSGSWLAVSLSPWRYGSRFECNFMWTSVDIRLILSSIAISTAFLMNFMSWFVRNSLWNRKDPV